VEGVEGREGGYGGGRDVGKGERGWDGRTRMGIGRGVGGSGDGKVSKRVVLEVREGWGGGEGELLGAGQGEKLGG